MHTKRLPSPTYNRPAASRLGADISLPPAKVHPRLPEGVIVITSLFTVPKCRKPSTASAGTENALAGMPVIQLVVPSGRNENRRWFRFAAKMLPSGPTIGPFRIAARVCRCQRLVPSALKA